MLAYDTPTCNCQVIRINSTTASMHGVARNILLGGAKHGTVSCDTSPLVSFINGTITQ